MNEYPKEVVAPGAWRTLGWTSLAVFMALLDATILFVAFPSIRASFPDVSAADLSWILNAYTIVYAALLVPAGRLADRVGRRRVFLIGVAVFTLGSLACAVAPTPALIVAGRVFQAVGGAMLTPSSLALVLAGFPRSKRSLAVSLWAAVGALAAAIGPSVGSAIIQFGGWRWAFLLNLPIGVAAVASGSRVLIESRDPNADERSDAIGVLLLISSIGLLALGLVRGRDCGAFPTLATLGASLALLVWFLRRSRKIPFPAVDLSLFESKSFRYANLATLVFGATFSAMFLGSVLFLTNVWGYSTFQAGLGMTPGPLMVVAMAPVAGRLAGRYGHRWLLVPGGIVFAFAFVMRYLVTSPTPRYLAEWLPPMILSGIGVGLVLPVLAAASTYSLPPNRFAVGSGVNQAIRQIGSVLGVVAIIALVGTARGPGALPAFSTVFLLLGLGGLTTTAISAAIDTRPGVGSSRVSSLAPDASDESARRSLRKEFKLDG
jgi:EmrB/QacA subfamily drug resistance transporter